MIYVLLILAAGLALAAWFARDRSTRIFLLLCCALNVAAAMKMMHDGFPYAYRLMPNAEGIEPAYFRD